MNPCFSKLFKLSALTAAAVLSACGGHNQDATSPQTGGMGQQTQSNDPKQGAAGARMQALTQSLPVNKIELAQTHVIPPAGLNWSLSGVASDLHLTGTRDTLILADLDVSDAVNPAVQVYQGTTLLGQMSLLAPNLLGNTEDGGDKYSSTAYSALLPAAWIKPNVTVKIIANNYMASTSQTLNVGANPNFEMKVLPFYVFGANETNSYDFATTSTKSAAVQTELYQKWPVSQMTIANHSAQKVQWPSLVIPPLNSTSAYVANNFEQLTNSAGTLPSGFNAMYSVYYILRAMRIANGDDKLAMQYYAPLMMLNAAGVYTKPGGGLGGGAASTGDAIHNGVFIHEAGHGFNMPHANDGYLAGKFPYIGGSLSGSRWGYDASRNEFLATHLPSTAPFLPLCTTTKPHQIDSQGRCIKQDIMQSGQEDRASSYLMGMLSDFNSGQVQNYLETTFYADSSFSSGYKVWNKTSKTWGAASNSTSYKGLYGLDNMLPVTRNVPVHAIVMTHSNAGTAGATQIYPPISYTGNLLRNIDPTSSTARNSVKPGGSGAYSSYCLNAGCDYTLRVTYTDNSTYHSIIPQGYRPWNTQNNPPAAASDPNLMDSFRTWTVNVPGTKALKKLELLSTPKVFNGMPTAPTVLAVRNL